MPVLINSLSSLTEDEDSDEEGMNGMEARRSSHLSASTSGQMPDQPEKAAATTRLRTRAFAASCLMNLPALVLSDERHFDPLLAQVLPHQPLHWDAQLEVLLYQPFTSIFRYT